MTRKGKLPVQAPNQALFMASNTLGDIAFKAVNASHADRDQNIVAILFSAAWFEASLNEALYDILERDLREKTERLARIRLTAQAAGIDARMVPIERRLQVLAAAATEKALAVEVLPWRDLLLLFRLRNWMIHLRPERMNVRPGKQDEPSSLVTTQAHELVSDLEAVGAIAEIPPGRLVSVATAVQLDGVSRWAYTTAYTALQELDLWLPERFGRLAEAHRSPERLMSTT